MSPAIRYTLARITIFLACLLLGWLLGLRDNPLLLLLIATTVSMFAEQVADKVEHRTERKQAKAARRRSDEVLEDDELDGAPEATSPRSTQEQPGR